METKPSKIKSVRAREILDSRGNPAVEAEIATEKGVFLASSPSGASRGAHEALEFRDGGKRYNGMGVKKAVQGVAEKIAPRLLGQDAEDQNGIDETLINLDGTENKSNLGANAMVAVSMAVCRAGAGSKNVPLYGHIKDIFGGGGKFKNNFPLPCFNIINGGRHAGNDLRVQEFMIIPRDKSFAENLGMGSEIYHALKDVLKNDFGPSAINVGDEGGFAPPISKTDEVLDILSEILKRYGADVKIGLDMAASEFYKGGKYQFEKADLSGENLLKLYERLVKNYPIIFLEDPFAEEDWRGFQEITKKLADKIDILGDDLLVTNVERINQARQKNACTGLIVKPNQAGTVTEAIEAAKTAKSFGWKIMASHRSGDTCDDFIADLAVGIGADYIKSGAPARGERVSKYNRLLKIEEEIWQS